MNELMKQIDDTRIELELTLEEAIDLRKILGKRKYKKAEPTESGCICPECGTKFEKGCNYCSCCGQALWYIENDVIPL